MEKMGYLCPYRLSLIRVSSSGKSSGMLQKARTTDAYDEELQAGQGYGGYHRSCASKAAAEPKFNASTNANYGCQ